MRNDLGTALILSGRRNEGKNEFLTAFNEPTNPTPEISSRNLGQAYLEEKHYPEAINWFRTSLNRNQTYPDAYLGLADALVAAGTDGRGPGHPGGGSEGMPAERRPPPRPGRGLFARRPARAMRGRVSKRRAAAIPSAPPGGARASSSSSSRK